MKYRITEYKSLTNQTHFRAEFKIWIFPWWFTMTYADFEYREFDSYENANHFINMTEYEKRRNTHTRVSVHAAKQEN